jgi:hypothetical protein
VLKIAALATLAAGLTMSAVQAQSVRRVFEWGREYSVSVSVDDPGTAVYAVSSTNQFGTNPGYLKQIVRWDPATGVGTPITSFEEGVESVSVSDDGSWLAFVSRTDPLGTNHDESPELFVMHPDGTGLAQLTSQSFSVLENHQAPRGVFSAVISGSGNRVAFVGRIDPLSTNPAATIALFVIDRDGTHLRQLRTDVWQGTVTAFVTGGTTAPDAPSFDISDDGSKIAFISLNPVELRGINADGTAPHAFTSTTNPNAIAIAGNGTKIVYTTGSFPNTAVRVRTFDGNPNTIVILGSGERPSITDDAASVYYYRYAAGPVVAGIWKIASTGGAQTLIALNLRAVAMSGTGNRIVARTTELVAIDGTGANLQQLTTTTASESGTDFKMSSDGSTVHFLTNMDPLGTNPAHDSEYFSYNLDTGQFWQRTNSGTPSMLETRMSDDGSVFFLSLGDPTGQNPCGDIQVFRLSPGGTYSQLTACGEPEPYFRDYLEVRPDGQVVVFLALVGFDYEVFAVNGDGTGRTQVTPSEPRDNINFGVSVAGTGADTWVAFVTGTTQTSVGGVSRVRTDGTGLQQLTTGAEAFSPNISADGGVVAWYSRHNFGQNPDGGFEDFVYDDATQTFQQMTNDYILYEPFPIVTQDGQWVFGDFQRFHVASGTKEYVRGGLPDATGTRWLIASPFDATASRTTLDLADVNAVPAFVVGKASPTVLSWDASPFSLRYDVVRGSISNLSIAGSTVSLGPVSCLEDDSPDSHTRGYADPVAPAPGQAFFYLYRGSVGFDAAAGSYGQGTGARERVAGAGGCNP